MKLLREFRISKLKSGQTVKFLIVLVTEIMLVVIGILLALEINNWNENRVARQSEKLLLKNLREEISINISELNIAVGYHNRSKQAIVKLLEIFSDDYKKYSPNHLDSLFAEVQWGWTFDPRLGVLNSVMNTGQIIIISNEKIKSFIVTFEETSTDSREESLICLDLIRNKYIPLINQYLSQRNRGTYIGFTMTRSKFESDYHGLFNDKEVENILAYLYIWRLDEYPEEMALLKSMEDCIVAIDESLQLME